MNALEQLKSHVSPPIVTPTTDNNAAAYIRRYGPALVELIEWSQRLTKQLAHLRDSGLQDHDAELCALGLKPVEINQAYDETVAALRKLTEDKPT